MKCKDCKFWRAFGSSLNELIGMGECRRHAPRAMPAAAAVIMGAKQNAVLGAVREDGYAAAGAGSLADRTSWWPGTHEDDFCGEFHVKRDPVF